MLKVWIFLFLMVESVFSSGCAYIPCVPSVTANTVAVTQIYEQKFLQINTSLDTIRSDYLEYSKLTNELNEKLAMYEALKVEYLLVLKEILNKQKSKVSLRDGK
jgi:hypothetical protein